MPNKPSTILHLVSEQTMQNLLPLLALKPERVVQVRSGDRRFERAGENLKSAVAAISDAPSYKDLAPEFIDMVIDEPSPSVESARRKVTESLSAWPGALVNLTGGTKPMSIGAYLAAAEACVPVLYCDTQEQRFACLNGQRSLPEMPAFADIALGLTLKTVMAAHGVNPNAWRGEKPGEDRIAFGRRALQCRLDHPTELQGFAKRLRQDFFKSDRFLRAQEFAERNLRPITDLSHPGTTEYLRAAAELGIVTQCDDGFHFISSLSRSEAEKAVKLLEGLWLELGLYALLIRNHRYGDVQWSLCPEDQQTAGFGETDVVCVDRRTTGLALFSCKSTPPKLEHLEALCRRRETLGGRFARAILCVGHGEPSDRERLDFWCRALGVELFMGPGIVAAFDSGEGLS